MKILCVDIGNSTIKAGLYEDGKALLYYTYGGAVELLELVKGINPDTIVLCSVQPQKTTELKAFLHVTWTHEPTVVDHSSRFSFAYRYEPMAGIGLDRLCGLEGALYAELQTGSVPPDYLITADLGTATTINILDTANGFAGGMIAPGMRTMAQALHHHTALLPEAELAGATEAPAFTTEAAISSGIANATVGLIERAVSRYSSKGSCTLYVTGGNARYITPLLNTKHKQVDALVSMGIYSVFRNSTR